MEKDKIKVEDRRTFDGPDGKTYYIAPPTADDIRGADWNYSKTYTKALTEGISTSFEMRNVLMARGLIGPEFEQRQRELQDILSEKIVELQSFTDIDERQRLAVEVANLREELFQWNQRLNGPMSNTCEQIADDARLEYLTASIIQKEDNSRVWDSYGAYLKEKSQSLAMRARFEVMLYLQGLESDFLEHTPEAIALREIREELQQKTMDAIGAVEKAKDEATKDVVKKENKKVSNKKTAKKNDTKE